MVKVPELYQDCEYCEYCGEPLVDEALRVLHETKDKSIEVNFCSAKCLQEYYEVLPKMELDRRFRQEANLIYKLVCPSCKKRFRHLVESGVVNE